MDSAPKSILVFRGGALGDVLLAGPALVQLRRAFPSAKMTVVARTAYAELLADTLKPVQCLELGSSRFSPVFLEGADLPDRLAGFVKSFDLVVSWLGPREAPFARNLLRAGAGCVLAAASFPQPDASAHAGDYLADTLSSLHMSSKPDALELTLPAYNAQTCDRLLADCGVKVTEPLLAVHPGSGGLKKCWPTERFVNVARRVAEQRGMQVLWLVGPAEIEQTERF